MVNEWFTAKDLAGAPYLPKSDRNIRIKAEKEGWKSRKRQKGKGLEYHISALPDEARVYFAKQEIEELCKTDPAAIAGRELVAEMEVVEKGKEKKIRQVKAQSLMAFNGLSGEKQTKANARLIIIKARETFIKPYADINKLTIGEKQFAESYNKRELGFELWVLDAVKQISWSTCRRWQKQLEEQGLTRLAGDYSANQRPGKVEQQPELQNYLVAVITGKPHLAKRPNVLCRMIGEKHEEYPHWDLPSASSIARWLSKWQANNGAKFVYLTNPDAYNSKHRPLFAKMYPWLKSPNDCWEFDSTPTDVQLRVNGKLVRYSIIAAIDVYTRRVKLLLSPTSNSEGICLLLRKCLMDWGVLNNGGIARTDNGSDYVSKRVTAIFDMLGVEQSRANPFSGWEKPFIERFFCTLSQGLLELLPGYIGHSVSDRQQIEAVKAFAERIGEGKKKAQQEALELALTPDELEEVMNDWLEHRYNHTAHEGLDGKTPFQVYSESGYRARVVADNHSLDYLLNYVGDATVLRGRISAGNIKYSAPELMNPDWDRKRVRVFLDPNDVGRATLYPVDNWEQFVEAVNIDLVGRSIDPAAFREQRKQQTKVLGEFRRSAKKLQEEFGINTQYAEALAADKAKNNLQAFSHKGEQSDNAAIAGLTQAAKQKPQLNIRSDAELERLEKAKEALLRREESVNQQKGLMIRNIHDKAKYLAELSLTQELTEKEKSFLEEYKIKNQFGRKTVEEIMARRHQA
ncbi:DNA-binding protein [Photobacterium sanguinicancri]|uniref:DNA-binding protein n=1 Tax=Photobacterium sanguinicancri TaxID=875932 RepID=UPI0026E47C9E|nr:DNA-binding protein [Photobacterium sanguinicancri]MDO6497359.1 DNA-binding protein [Photobacterium sanguinicancri]